MARMRIASARRPLRLANDDSQLTWVSATRLRGVIALGGGRSLATQRGMRVGPAPTWLGASKGYQMSSQPAPVRPGIPPFRPLYPLSCAELQDALQLGDAKLGAIMTSAGDFRARRTIVPAEQSHNQVHRIRSGWAARIRYLKDGRAQVSAVMLPGDLFALGAMFRPTQFEEIVAITDVAIESADARELRAAAKQDWDIMQRLAWQWVEDDRRMHKWLIALAQGSADERLALLLLDIRARLAFSSAIDADAAHFPWPLTQQDMGQILGLTAVHVNRTWKTLREKGLATVQFRQASIDVPGLMRVAHPLLDLFERRGGTAGAAEAV